MRLLIDMDGVITDFNKRNWDAFEAIHRNWKDKYPRPNPILDFYAEDAYPDQEFKDAIRKINSAPLFFLELSPIEGAIEALHDLETRYEVFICTAPMLENPTCCNDKLEWIDNHLGGDWTRRTIITKDKTVIDGDILIDDKPVITGVTDEPIWQRIIFDQPYNKNVVGPRLNWKTYNETIEYYGRR